MDPVQQKEHCDSGFRNLETSFFFFKEENYLAPISLSLSSNTSFSLEPLAVMSRSAVQWYFPSVMQPGRWGAPSLGTDSALIPECSSAQGGLLTWGHWRPHHLLWGLALQPQGPSLKATQVVVQRLDVGEDAHGVRLAAHHHHVLHLNEALTVGQVPETQKPHQNVGPSHQPASLPGKRAQSRAGSS